MKRAVVLLSGGLDSATTLAICRARGLRAVCAFFRLRAAPQHELEAAKRVAASLGAREHRVAHDRSARVRRIGVNGRHRRAEKPRGESRGRNSRSPTFRRGTRSSSLTRSPGAKCSARRTSFIGANAVDYSGYPDCRPDFHRGLRALADVATKAGVEGTRFRIHAPLLSMSKADIIRKGTELGVDFSLTHSCYDPTADGVACGACDSCRIGWKVFAAPGCRIRFLTRASETVLRYFCSHAGRTASCHFRRAAARRLRVVQTSSRFELRVGSRSCLRHVCHRLPPSDAAARSHGYNPGICP